MTATSFRSSYIESLTAIATFPTRDAFNAFLGALGREIVLFYCLRSPRRPATGGILLSLLKSPSDILLRRELLALVVD